MKENKLLSTKNVVLMGMFGALAGVLMIFEIPLPFIAPRPEELIFICNCIISQKASAFKNFLFYLKFYVTNLILNCLIGCRNKICRNRHLQKAKERKKT